MDMLETNVGGHASYLHRMDHQRHHGIVLAPWLEAAMTENGKWGDRNHSLSLVLCVLTFAPRNGIQM